MARTKSHRRERPKPLKPEQREALLDALNDGSLLEANSASRDIFQFPDPALLPGILRVLRQGRRLRNRVEAAYALRAMHGLEGTATLERFCRIGQKIHIYALSWRRH